MCTSRELAKQSALVPHEDNVEPRNLCRYLATACTAETCVNANADVSVTKNGRFLPYRANWYAWFPASLLPRGGEIREC